MTDNEQKKIFARNLTSYILLNKKQQNEVAKDLGIKPTTFNMWCNGNSMPGTGKIRALADYFGIGMTDLTDDKSQNSLDEEYATIVMSIGKHDTKFRDIIIAYSKMTTDEKKALCDFFDKFILK